MTNIFIGIAIGAALVTVGVAVAWVAAVDRWDQDPPKPTHPDQATMD